MAHITRFAFVLSAVFALAISLARQQSSSEHDLRALLIPPQDCAMPCFLGVQPGVTPIDDAVILLSAHPWVSRVVVERRPLVHYLYWEWSELSPAFVDDSNSRMPPHLWAQNEIVRYILLPTTIPFGDIMRLFGEPDAGLFTVSRYQNRTVFATNTHHTAAYYGARFVIDTDVYCPVEPSMFWNAPSTISYYAFPNARDRMRDYDLHSWLYTGDCARRSR